MLILDLIGIIIAMCITYFIVWQVVIPLVKGMPTFPMFRIQKKLETEIAHAYDDMDAIALKKRLKELQTKLDQLKENE